MTKIKPLYIGSGLMTLAALVIMLIKPFSANLNETAHIMLGGILITLCIWIFKPFNLPYAVGGLVLALIALIIGLPPSAVFSGFTQTAIWTLIPALFFGFTLHKTGLGKRIALTIIKLFKPSYPSLVIAWVLIGAALSVLTPSTTVRIAIVIPVAVQCCELCKLQKGTKGNSLILLTAFGMALVPGSGWLSGVLWGPIIQGMVNAAPGMEGLVTFNSWFGVLFLPMLIITVILVAGSLLFLMPKEKISKETADILRRQPLDKMNRQEIFAAVILSVVFLLFLTSGLHGLSITVICLSR